MLCNLSVTGTLFACSGKGMRVGDDGEEVPAYYHQWAAKIQDMSPARQADVLDQLGEEDRLIVQRILDHAAVQRSNDSAMSGISHSQRSRTRPVSPTGSDSSPPPPPYPGAAGTSRPSTRPASPQAERAGDSRKAAQAEQGGRGAESASARGQTSAQQKPKSAADLGIFDFESQSSAELEETRAESRAAESRAAESRAAEAEPVRAAPQRTSAPAQHSQQRPQQPGSPSAVCHIHSNNNLNNNDNNYNNLQVFHLIVLARCLLGLSQVPTRP